MVTNAIVRYPDDPYNRIRYAKRERATQRNNPSTNDHHRRRRQPAPTRTRKRNHHKKHIPIHNYGPSISQHPNPEVTELDSTQKRSFEAFKNNQSFSTPMVPPFENVTEFYASNITAYPNTSFRLVATPDSTLHPLINAMEVFRIGGPVTNGTDANDAVGLASLQSEFDVLQGWGGDPCLPAPYSWEWINCTSDATPRVTALYLGSYGLSGPLQDFSSMTALEIIDMNNNSISGPIREFLGTLPNLKELAAGSATHFGIWLIIKLTGYMPTYLSNNNRLKLLVTGNPNLCTSEQCPILPSSGSSKKRNNRPAILGATIPAFIIFWAIAGVLVLAILHHKRKTAVVAAIDAGQNIGANNMPNGTKQGNTATAEIVGNLEESVLMNELKANNMYGGTWHYYVDGK
ncbi:hypothetical protein RHMOL_Rhmol13G0108100 [Rhododendron molle]|uniref:Uncharacterized protein n=1 Tax=Rhododendron molle TaxID=49168 RepID=A0ACC0L6A0_RHOML|nr:hypothetical protein RHMOL_Rhmol13G0108100 [Rhododendron molle]